MVLLPKQTKVCRVCGKTYESCKSVKTGSSAFNWREMCCSPECGQIYFQRVQEARHQAAPAPAQENGVQRVTSVADDPIVFGGVTTTQDADTTEPVAYETDPPTDFVDEE